MGRKTFQTDEPCLFCEFEQPQRCWHHIATRGANGEINEPWNLMPVCQKHHVYVESAGLYRITHEFKNQKIKNWLIERGWEGCSISKKWIHEKGLGK
ncbi:MAG: hypothetical protein ACPGJV_14165 [Bacteriovoracaceae bacterium]